MQMEVDIQKQRKQQPFYRLQHIKEPYESRLQGTWIKGRA